MFEASLDDLVRTLGPAGRPQVLHSFDLAALEVEIEEAAAPDDAIVESTGDVDEETDDARQLDRSLRMRAIVFSTI